MVENSISICFINQVPKAIIWLYDVTGKAVINLTVNNCITNYHLNVEPLVNGMYLLKVDLQKESFAERVIISK